MPDNSIDRSEIFEKQISPLLEKIVNICKKNNFPMIITAHFHDQSLNMVWTRYLPEDGQWSHLEYYCKILRDQLSKVGKPHV